MVTPVEKLRKRLADIRERAEKATPGPWKVTGEDKHWRENMAYVKVRGTVPGHHWPIADCRYVDSDGFSNSDIAKGIANFIAASRTDIPALVAICEALLDGCNSVSNSYGSDSIDRAIVITDEALEKASKVGER